MEPGDGQATVTVTPGNGGGPADSYVVTAQPGGDTCTVTPPETSCVITGLTNGTVYSFEAIAKNPAGDSSASTSVDSTPAAPTSPGGNTTDGGTTGGSTSGGGTTTNNTLSPGDVNATVNGVPVEVDVNTSSNGTVTIKGSDFSMSFDSPTSGSENGLFLPQGGNVTFKGNGFKSNSNVDSTLTTTNTKLGSAKVTKSGTFSSKLSIPRSTRSGNHQLSVTGKAKSGADRTIEVGVKVAKMKKVTVKTFRVYSTKLRPKLRRQSNRIVKQKPTAVHCEGFVRPSKANNLKDIARATKRAKSVCAYVKKRNKAIHTTFGVSPSPLNRRRVEVSYR